jgi:GT2 family glycosyltransferase/glycosyltransferase involved in cell wall biosynthesis
MAGRRPLDKNRNQNQESAELLEALKNYENFLNRELKIYRGQRAWKLMLLFRKLYTNLVREAPKDPLGALRKLFREPLAEHELKFPNLWDFMSTEAMTSLAAGAAPAKQGGGSLDRGHGEPAVEEAKYPIICMPIFDFDMRFQRPQQILARFAASGHKVYWISPSRRPSPDSGAAYELAPLRRNIIEVRLDSPDHNLYTGEMTPALLDSMASGLEEMIAREGLAECWSLVQFPFWRKLALRLNERFGYPLLYDCMDNFEEWPIEPKPSAANCADEKALFAEASLVTVSAETLGRIARRHGAEPVLVPNGADVRFFERAIDNSEIGGLTGPVIGYFGAVAEWFDFEAVAHMAASRPDYNFVIIGRIEDPDRIPRLKALPNIHLFGERKYVTLPSFLKRFDVCLIPFRLSPLLEYANIVKLYEYFSQGKPVVTSRLSQLNAPLDLVYFAGTHEEYVRQIDAALNESDVSLVRRRIEFAHANTWNDRMVEMDRAMRRSTPRVSILVLTYNSGSFLPEFHRYFIKNTAWPSWELIYADNCSSDATPDILSGFTAADPRVRAILLDRNLGFAGGNNAAAKQATGEYLIFLNPDTVVTHGWVHRLLAPLMRDPKVGMSAPVTNHSGNQTRIDVSYSGAAEMEEFAASLARARHGQTFDVPMAPLLCAAIRRQTWEQIGELDARFEVGMFEDDDYGIRLKQAGLKTVTAEDCFIHHFGSGSFRQLDPEHSIAVFNANREIFEKKWGIKWQQHQMRPGVQPLSAAKVYSPTWFFAI